MPDTALNVHEHCADGGEGGPYSPPCLGGAGNPVCMGLACRKMELLFSSTDHYQPRVNFLNLRELLGPDLLRWSGWEAAH